MTAARAEKPGPALQGEPAAPRGSAKAARASKPVLGSLVAAVLCCAASVARAEVTGEIFSDPERGIRFAAPEGWTLSQHLGYPSLLAVLTPKAPQSRIYLALVPLQGSGGDRQRSLHRTATQTATTLRPLGIEVISSRADEVAGRTAWLLTARYPVRAGQPVLVRQLYLPHGRRQALVLTLATTAARLTADLADRDYVIESLEQTAAPSTATQQQD